jgi:hypothetical protein
MRDARQGMTPTVPLRTRSPTATTIAERDCR